MNENLHVVWHEHSVTREDRVKRNGHRGCVVWFTGLSASGKSTIANRVEQILYRRDIQTYLLDGDNVRHGLCAGPNLLKPIHGDEFAKRFGLGFSAEDREENIRRVGAVTELFASAGMICLTAFVSPYRRDRDRARAMVESQCGQGSFIEVFVNTPLDVCIKRDPKGLYKQAIAGSLPNFTGISDVYEQPVAPELELDGANEDIDLLGRLVVDRLSELGVIRSGG